MNKRIPKLEPLVVTAIRQLGGIRGSTMKDISNYISDEYSLPRLDIKKRVEMALRRGLSYGIFARTKGGGFTCTMDALREPMDDCGVVDCGHRRKMKCGSKPRRRKSRGCKPKRRSRRRKSSCGCGMKKRRRSRRRKSGCKPRRRRRTRSKSSCRRKSRSRSRSRRRRMRRGKKCSSAYGEQELSTYRRSITPNKGLKDIKDENEENVGLPIASREGSRSRSQSPGVSNANKSPRSNAPHEYYIN